MGNQKKRWFRSYVRITGRRGQPARLYGAAIVDEHPMKKVAQWNRRAVEHEKEDGVYDHSILLWFTSDIPDDIGEYWEGEVEAG